MIEESLLSAIVRGECGDPFAVLGMHRQGSALKVTAFLPGARSVALLDTQHDVVAGNLDALDPAGLFGATLAHRSEPFAYRLRVTRDGHTEDLDDPYRFPLILSDDDIWLLAEGRHHKLWEVLGAHPCELLQVQGTRFAVWAPNAHRVSVVCDANDWDPRRHPMRLRSECGVWELFIPGVAAGIKYKYDILEAGGGSKQKADPVAFASELRPATASVVCRTPGFVPTDSVLPPLRSAYAAPVAIYEVHPGSWRRPADGRQFLNWRELADQLVDYVQYMGFSHIELMPVSEHPFDGSWGYQPLGLYAPTSRFGTAEGFRQLVDACHEAEIGVLLDWVPGHFPSDDFGLGLFDGTHLYEHADPRQGYHPDWNTLIYNYGRAEVRNFLTANALYWLECYGVDGLRVDAVASMLYLDYSRAQGEWIPNPHGGRENLDAVDFMKEFNSILMTRRPGAVTIAEESTAWPKVSRPVADDGLGFTYKWNMGWMHDTLSYMRREAVHRKYHHHDMTFGLLYAFTENFVLPLSHDEVVHGKGSLLGKMPGDEWQKFANLRAYYGFMYGHPGKKLLFMGGEFAQVQEWNHERSLDWHLCDQPLHKGMQTFVRDLNRLYRRRPELYELDFDPSGFEWIVADDADQSVFVFLRRARDRTRHIIIAVNFTPVPRMNYQFGVPAAGPYAELLNSDAAIYGGSNAGNLGRIETTGTASHRYPYSLSLTLPPLAVLVLTPAESAG